jgi:hypothetical protein
MRFLCALSTCSLIASCAAVNLTGRWLLSAGYEEGYTLVPSSPDLSHYAVTCVDGPCTSWKTASITLNASTGSLRVHFDSGFEDAGVLSDAPYFDAIAWSRSSWRRAPPPRPLLTVHVVPHSHNDPVRCAPRRQQNTPPPAARARPPFSPTHPTRPAGLAAHVL